MKYVYLFSEGDASMRNTLGGKGANLCQMTKLKLPVPQGFIVSTDACCEFQKTGTLDKHVLHQIKKALTALERISGKKFGDAQNPLLLSVRSGARVSMPGMMDTILNLGLNDEIVEKYATHSQNAWFCYDCYRRFIQMYSEVVHKIDSALFEEAIDELKATKGIKLDQEFALNDLKKLISTYKKIFRAHTKKAFPQDVFECLLDCIIGVFSSWNNPRAKVYREMNSIPHEWGTAVNVQQMVFGNLNEQSGTGVCFSRNPATGKDVFFGEFLMNAQGEDIVAGVRTPMEIAKLKEVNAAAYEELYGYAKRLETVYLDMQDMEFTIENGKLYVLQTRNGKRTTQASVKIAVDMVKEGLIEKSDAIGRIEAGKISELLTAKLEVPKGLSPIATGIGAAPGGAVGRIALTSEKAAEFKANNEPCILVRNETSADDISGMSLSQGVLTARGGMTSHAAVVARGIGTACVSGCADLKVLEKSIKIGTKTFKEGDWISLDGASGKVFEGALKTTASLDNKELGLLLDWASEAQEIRVFANADTKKDAILAKKFNAGGIGLCRTEHMFFDPVRVNEMQKMLLAPTDKTRQSALKKLLSYQKSDFEGIFSTLAPKSVTIRLLDPPLHEFMPKTLKDIKELADSLEMSVADVNKQIADLEEVNPMMGHRGLRLAISAPEIYQMQVRAIVESALNVQNKSKVKVLPEIMIPLTSDVMEFLFVKNLVMETIREFDAKGELEIKIGTMIETPRACVLAERLAKECDFFSFGTNDLTQFMFGFSRDDSGKFLPKYYENHIFAKDIFMHLDEEGVGEMMKMAIQKARRANPKIVLGICGEHGGDPDSIEFCKKLGLDYVSCSVMRLPVAHIASC